MHVCITKYIYTYIDEYIYMHLYGGRQKQLTEDMRDLAQAHAAQECARLYVYIFLYMYIYV